MLFAITVNKTEGEKALSHERVELLRNRRQFLDGTFVRYDGGRALQSYYKQWRVVARLGKNQRQLRTNRGKVRKIKLEQ